MEFMELHKSPSAMQLSHIVVCLTMVLTVLHTVVSGRTDIPALNMGKRNVRDTLMALTVTSVNNTSMGVIARNTV